MRTEHGPRELDPADEDRHAPDGSPSWCEVFALDFVAGDGTVAGSTALVLHPARRSCTFWTCLVGRERRLLTIVETDVALPRGLEVRAPGLWFEIQCLVPYDHVMLGLEAFAVGLDDPADALGKLWGDRVPFGLDLEWDTASPDDVRPLAHGAAHGYEMHCLVHGEVLVADERIELDGFGSRTHTWGAIHPWAAPGARTVAAGAVGHAAPDPSLVDPIAEAPLLVDLGGAPLRMDRALAVVHDADQPHDRPGRLTWIERSHPC